MEVEPINQAAETVQGLGVKYVTKTAYAKKLLDGIGLVRSMTLIDKIPQLKALAPQLELVLTAVTLGVLGLHALHRLRPRRFGPGAVLAALRGQYPRPGGRGARDRSKILGI